MKWIFIHSFIFGAVYWSAKLDNTFLSGGGSHLCLRVGCTRFVFWDTPLISQYETSEVMFRTGKNFGNQFEIVCITCPNILKMGVRTGAMKNLGRTLPFWYYLSFTHTLIYAAQDILALFLFLVFGDFLLCYVAFTWEQFQRSALESVTCLEIALLKLLHFELVKGTPVFLTPYDELSLGCILGAS